MGRAEFCWRGVHVEALIDQLELISAIQSTQIVSKVIAGLGS